jgi:hypothetical protein
VPGTGPRAEAVAAAAAVAVAVAVTVAVAGERPHEFQGHKVDSLGGLLPKNDIII